MTDRFESNQIFCWDTNLVKVLIVLIARGVITASRKHLMVQKEIGK